MSADRELLVLAAKAAGMGFTAANFAAPGEFYSGWGMVLDLNYYWNPLNDDGDALRLATELELDIEFDYKADGPQTYVTVVGREVANRTSYEHHGDEKHSATRRAIVRAAAEIGKAMP